MSASVRDETGPAFPAPLSTDSVTSRAAPQPNPNDPAEIEIDAGWGAELSRDQLIKLFKAVLRIRQLRLIREDALLSQMLCREKMRDVGFKRDYVSTCDSNLMRQFQTLVAQGKMDGHPELLELFNRSQQAHDTLGPLEKEAIDAELTLEGKWSKVEKVENLVYNSLFGLSENLPPASPGSSLHASDSASEHDSFEFEDDSDQSIKNEDDKQNQLIQSYISSTLPSLTSPQSPTNEVQIYENTIPQFSFDSDMILQDEKDVTTKSTPNGSQLYYSTSQSPSVIDHGLDNRPYGYQIPQYPMNKSSSTNLDFNPRLLLDFTTIRERVNNWILHHLLLSRLEAEFMKIRLDAENPKSPSNWAQLIIAWWGKDAAANPSHENTVSIEKSELPKEQKMNFGRPKSASDPITRGNGWDTRLPAWEANSNRDQIPSPLASHNNKGVSPAHELSHSAISTPLGAKERFVLLLFEHEKLHPLFEQAKIQLRRDEFCVTFRFQLLLLLENLLLEAIEARSSSNQKLAQYFVDEYHNIATMMRAAVYRPKLHNLPVPGLPAVGLSKTNLTGEGPQIGPEALAELSDDIPQLKQRLDAAEVTNSPDFPESFQEFVLQSKAFRVFCDNFTEDFNVQDEPLSLESDNSPTPLPHEPLTSLDRHLLSNSQLSLQSRMSTSNTTTQPDSNLGMNDQILNKYILLDRDTNPLNVSESGTIENKSEEEISQFDSAYYTDEREAVRANSSRKRETEAANIQSEMTPTQVHNGVKLQNQSYSDVLNQGLPTVKRPPTRPRGTLPAQIQPITKPRTDIFRGRSGKNQTKQGNNPGDVEEHENGVKTPIPTPTGARPAKSEVPRISSQWGSTVASHTSKLMSESGKTVWGLENPSWRGERSDKSFKQHEKGEFAWGKVFKIQWTEPQGDSVDSETVISFQQKKQHGDRVHRFVIVDKREEYCKCLAIKPYKSRRTAKADLDANSHPIIYTETPKLINGESTLSKPAIRVNPTGPQHKLEDGSRLSYSKIYRVEYDVKICFIGRVDANSERELELSCQASNLSIQIRKMPSPPPPAAAAAAAAVPVTYAQVARFSGREQDSQSSIRSFSSSGFSGRGPGSQSTQSSVFPVPIVPTGPKRTTTFAMTPQIPPKTWTTKARWSRSPTRLPEGYKYDPWRGKGVKKDV